MCHTHTKERERKRQRERERKRERERNRWKQTNVLIRGALRGPASLGSVPFSFLHLGGNLVLSQVLFFISLSATPAPVNPLPPTWIPCKGGRLIRRHSCQTKSHFRLKCSRHRENVSLCDRPRIICRHCYGSPSLKLSKALTALAHTYANASTWDMRGCRCSNTLHKKKQIRQWLALQT